MSFGRIKLDPNDVLFSKMIRERDGACVFCGRRYGKLENSHFWGRGNKTTRFNALNCDALCFQCHAQNEGNKQGFYRSWKLKQLGEEVYNDLERLARMTGPYGEWEKEIINKSLKAQESARAHLEKGWVGITYQPSFGINAILIAHSPPPPTPKVKRGPTWRKVRS